MKSFLAKADTKKPIIQWGMLPNNVFYEGDIPEGYILCVCPSENYIVVDVDRHGKVDGFDNVPVEILSELATTFNYPTKNNGRHYWVWYTGTKTLMNKASGLGIDLRIGAKGSNCGGYVTWHPRNEMDIRNEITKIKNSSEQLNSWLEKLFT